MIYLTCLNPYQQCNVESYRDPHLFIRDVILKIGGCPPRGVMVKAMDCGIVVREFVLQSRYYIHFRANTLGKGREPPYPTSYGLNSSTTIFLGEWLWHWITCKGWYAIKQRNQTKPIKIGCSQCILSLSNGVYFFWRALPSYSVWVLYVRIPLGFKAAIPSISLKKKNI